MKNKKFYLILIIAVLIVSVIAGLYLFNPFRSESACGSYAYSDCPQRCVVCPSCEFCSSVRCQTEESCAKIGFNRTWHESIKKRLQETD
ncbi:MAG: hypothetical protein WAX07_00235 [Candidatus Altiarchaeia archaeon]